ncbi:MULTISPECIES: hypothetical protein [unclassified Marinobacterium]|uniref:hypothetical protein n=1 Tax=unclassified Marinobacterium TaxID=2644139 RepID=UPI001568C7E9|nr:MULTISPECIES: hypothetical protein [unclassified Marinobacterium]NRP46021.1 hypothetical protein [Marinobacterium sp. xm-d-543]NRQ22356.1 hypothetical protein [Marinobacterium sp. xm-m-312]
MTSILLNDGDGGFSYDLTMVPTEIKGKNLYISELVDVDLDGYLYLVVGGHEFQGAETLIYWGSESPGFSNDLKTVIPEAAGYQIVIDIDVADIDLDGANEVVLTRVGSPPINDFYDGFYLQVLNQESRAIDDITSFSFPNNILASELDQWLSWTRLADVDRDGDLDIFFDDDWNFLPEFIAFNDGNGIFAFT